MTKIFESKQTSEAFLIDFDFTDVLLTATIASVTSIIALDQVSLADVSLTVLDSSKQTNTTVKVYTGVRAGTTGHRYTITCKIVDSAGAIWELDAVLPVEDLPTVKAANGNCTLAPLFEPVTLEELKLHLRIASDQTDEDDLLEEIITVAREHVEDLTSRAIITQTWKYYLSDWPDSNFIKLPNGNLQSVSSVKWKDTAGAETTLTAGTDYLVETNNDHCGKVVLPYAVSWPSGTLYPSKPITIEYICGWTKASLVPSRIKSAIKLLCADYYENRGEPVLGMTMIQNKTADMLLASLRLFDEFEGC